MKPKMDPDRCQKMIHRDGSSAWNMSQCSRKGVVTEEGQLWCRQHAPRREEQRRQILEVAYEERRRQERMRKRHDEWLRVLELVRAKDPKLAEGMERFARKHGVFDCM